MLTKGKIALAQRAVKLLAGSIRRLSESQKSAWQKIPYLALQADGRTGYLDQYSRAYRQGYWAIASSAQRGYYAVYVDLETGKLVSAFNPRKPATDEDLISFAVQLSELDAGAIIRKLRLEAAKGTDGRFYDPRKQAFWRAETAAELGLGPDSYVRAGTIPEEVHKASLVAGLIN